MLPQNTFILKIENLRENLFKAKHLQSGRNSVFWDFLPNGSILMKLYFHLAQTGLLKMHSKEHHSAVCVKILELCVWGEELLTTKLKLLQNHFPVHLIFSETFAPLQGR